MQSIVKLSLIGVLSINFSGCINNKNNLTISPINKEFNAKFRTACLDRKGKVGWNLAEDRITCTIKNNTISGNNYGLEQILAMPNEFDMYGYDNDGYDKNGFNLYGYDRNGFNIYNIHKITKTTFDTAGYDKDGYDRNGFNRDNIHKITKTAFNTGGYDKDGYDKNGFNIYNIHKITKTAFDTAGYNKDGYDRNGYNKNGLSRQEIERKKYYEEILAIERQRLEYERRQAKAAEDANNQAEWDSVNRSLQNLNNSMQNNTQMLNQRTESLRQQNYQYMNNSNNTNKNLYYMQKLTPNLYYVK